jgi:hypothetical protein
MIADTPRRNLLQRQAQTLRSMAAAYGEGLTAMAEMNLDGIFQQTQTLEGHCQELRLLNRQMSSTVAGPGDAEWQCAVVAARWEVRRLNQIFRSVARRSARNVKTLLHIINPTYSPANKSAQTYRSGAFHTYA